MNTDNMLNIADSRTLRFSDARTYMFAVLFIAGNIIMPQLCHLVPGGGMIWLPIYFFTLVGAYLYGWRVGLLTALASPLVNSFLFGMPPVAVLPAIMMKSSLLAIAASVGSHLGKHNVTLPVMFAVVLCYQSVGTVGEWAMGASWHIAFQDFRIGIPGMLLQVLGGYVLLKYVERKRAF